MVAEILFRVSAVSVRIVGGVQIENRLLPLRYLVATIICHDQSDFLASHRTFASLARSDIDHHDTRSGPNDGVASFHRDSRSKQDSLEKHIGADAVPISRTVSLEAKDVAANQRVHYARLRRHDACMPRFE